MIWYHNALHRSKARNRVLCHLCKRKEKKNEEKTLKRQVQYCIVLCIKTDLLIFCVCMYKSYFLIFFLSWMIWKAATIQAVFIWLRRTKQYIFSVKVSFKKNKKRKSRGTLTLHHNSLSNLSLEITWFFFPFSCVFFISCNHREYRMLIYTGKTKTEAQTNQKT